MSYVIAIANQKGGVAKTTTCLSLGASLAELGKEVLLVDLDPQANLTLSLGLAPQDQRHTVGDVLLGQHTLVAVSQEGPMAGLGIVPANQGLVVLDKVLYGRPNYEYRLKDQLSDVDDFYDLVLIDCPPAFGTLTLNALTAAQLLVIPVQCEYYAARALHPVLKLVQLVRQKTNACLSYRILVTMYDRRNKISQVILGKVQEKFKTALLDTIIEIDTKLRESPTLGLPINLYAPRTRATRQYRGLAKELISHG